MLLKRTQVTLLVGQAGMSSCTAINLTLSFFMVRKGCILQEKNSPARKLGNDCQLTRFLENRMTKAENELPTKDASPNFDFDVNRTPYRLSTVARDWTGFLLTS